MLNRSFSFPIALSFFVGLLVLPAPALATFSIIACDRETGTCGVAVATNNLAVGASVCYAKAGVGALVSQFETNPNYGPFGLKLLEQKVEVNEALRLILASDNDFEGVGIDYRQVALVNVAGQNVVHSGKEALRSGWTGSKSGSNYSIQGNGLVGELVINAMEEAFLASKAVLAERLMAALIAGQNAGGQTTGQMSASLLVRTIDGWPFDIDLRVDVSQDAVSDLKGLLELHNARQSIIRAERFARNGDLEMVWPSIAEALHLGHSWDRIWRRSARLAMRLDEPERALEYLGVFMSLNSGWAQSELEDSLYAPLHDSPLFQKWQKKP